MAVTNSLEQDFLELMQDTVTITPVLGSDSYNQPTLGAPQRYRCRIEYRTRLIRTTDKFEAVSSCQIYMFKASGARPKDTLTMPDGSQPPILHIDKQGDEHGANYLEVLYTV